MTVNLRFLRFAAGGAVHFAVATNDGSVRLLTETPFSGYVELAQAARGAGTTIGDVIEPWLHSATTADVTLEALDRAPGPAPHLVTPFDPPEIWGAAFTYDLRTPEPRFDDAYIAERRAKRTVIFFKTTPFRASGPNAVVGSRSDTTLMIPEPELGVILDRDGAILGYTAVNDVSSRDLPREEPLYVAYSKTFRHCVSFGPCIVPPEARPADGHWIVSASVERDGATIWEDTNSTRRCYRSWDELRDALLSHNDLLPGTLYATGTALSPPQHMHIREGDLLDVSIEGIGHLRNPVVDV